MHKQCILTSNEIWKLLWSTFTFLQKWKIWLFHDEPIILIPWFFIFLHIHFQMQQWYHIVISCLQVWIYAVYLLVRKWQCFSWNATIDSNTLYLTESWLWEKMSVGIGTFHQSNFLFLSWPLWIDQWFVIRLNVARHKSFQDFGKKEKKQKWK